MRLILATATMCLLFAPAVMAQPTIGSVTVDVPFGFYVADVSYPAGTYVIERAAHAGSVRLAPVDTNEKARYMLVIPFSEPTKYAGKSVAVFAKYESGHTFLKQIWNADRGAGWDLPPCRTERQFATPKFVAAGTPETLTILARAR